MSDDKKKKKYWDEDPFDRFFRSFFGGRSPFDEFFREIDEMIRRMMRDFEGFTFFPPELEEALKRGRGKTYVYGFSITIGPDGRPIIRKFGNIKPTPLGTLKTEEFEPLSTVYEENGKIKVVVDLPGARKESIRINASEDEVEVEAEGEDRRYFKRIKLPVKVDPDSAKARYENGILEIVFEKKEKEKKKKEIKVE